MQPVEWGEFRDLPPRGWGDQSGVRSRVREVEILRLRSKEVEASTRGKE